MYAVIFMAEMVQVDDDYNSVAARMRELAKECYGCVEFVTVAEGNREISISYWESEAQIRAWKQDPEHLLAQEAGRSKWYKSYTVQVVEVKRQYHS